MHEMVDVAEAARELDLDPSRVRALIAHGALQADKIGGRWLVHRDSVLARRREPASAGRPMSPHNAWALLLDASGEAPPAGKDPAARWRGRQALLHQGLIALRGRLAQRAQVHRLWALPGELRALHADGALVLSGSSAAGALGLDLVAPDTVDAYLPARCLDAIAREYGLEEAPESRANISLRAVPEKAWVLDDRRIAPQAAVALDLAAYSDPRSARVGMELLERLEHGAGSEHHR